MTYFHNITTNQLNITEIDDIIYSDSKDIILATTSGNALVYELSFDDKKMLVEDNYEILQKLIDKISQEIDKI